MRVDLEKADLRKKSNDKAVSQLRNRVVALAQPKAKLKCVNFRQPTILSAMEAAKISIEVSCVDTDTCLDYGKMDTTNSGEGISPRRVGASPTSSKEEHATIQAESEKEATTDGEKKRVGKVKSKVAPETKSMSATTFGTC